MGSVRYRKMSKATTRLCLICPSQFTSRYKSKGVSSSSWKNSNFWTSVRSTEREVRGPSVYEATNGEDDEGGKRVTQQKGGWKIFQGFTSHGALNAWLFRYEDIEAAKCRGGCPTIRRISGSKNISGKWKLTRRALTDSRLSWIRASFLFNTWTCKFRAWKVWELVKKYDPLR